MRATVRDVARLAGVSPKTVSNVVNGQVPVSPLTRGKVEAAVAELNYVPNLSARGLRNGRSGVIALAMPDLTSAYTAEMVHHIVLAAARRNWSVQIEESGLGAEPEAQLLNRAREHLIDGLILNPVLLETSAVQRGVALPPVVLIGEVDQPIADHVWIDNVAAAAAMTKHLIDSGHRRIGCLGRMESATSRLRVRGYRAALRAAGLPVATELIIGCKRWTPEGGYLATRNWLARHDPPDALFAFTDSLALGAQHAFAEAGLRVPEDISLVGYDDVPESAHVTPPLTTIGFDKPAFAEATISLLADRVADPDLPIRTRTVDYCLITRESVSRCR